ncbi:MAG: acyltransferase [Dorea sp.]|nr:acyltransferase [Dorea sp.]
MFKDLRYQFFRLFVSLLPWGTMRTKWIVKKNVFRAVGENFYFCPRKIPADPKYIIFHNNVSVAADVVFCNHDVIYKVFNSMGGGYRECSKYYGCIEVMDHVFIGTKSVILPNVRIGSNVIIAAGSIVTKDLESGGVYAGNPAKRIGDFGNILDNRLNWTKAVKGLDDNSLQNYLWDDFLNKRK